MAGQSYTSQVIVLRKTKLGESDLILAFLAQDGSQIKAVAKGARKPNNTFASRLELYSVAEVLCSKGRNLDIVKEARLIAGNEAIRSDIIYAAGAAPIAELLDKTIQLGLENPRLFDMTQKAFSVLGSSAISAVPSITAAHLLKTFAFSGVRPVFRQCVACGSESLTSDSGMSHVSYHEGGVLCINCASQYETILMDNNLLQWVELVITSTFEQVRDEKIPLAVSFALLQFCHTWIKEHFSVSLKSLNFMLSSGLYEEDR